MNNIVVMIIIMQLVILYIADHIKDTEVCKRFPFVILSHKTVAFVELMLMIHTVAT